jgi:hypothetical protein
MSTVGFGNIASTTMNEKIFGMSVLAHIRDCGDLDKNMRILQI